MAAGWQQQVFALDARYNAHRAPNHPNFSMYCCIIFGNKIRTPKLYCFDIVSNEMLEYGSRCRQKRMFLYVMKCNMLLKILLQRRQSTLISRFLKLYKFRRVLLNNEVDIRLTMQDGSTILSSED